MADIKNLVEGKYLMYKDRPLVREGDTICYGDMSESCYLILEIMSYKTQDGNELPENILVQVIDSKDNKIIKQDTKKGLYDAFTMGVIWLEHALASSKH